MFAVLRKNEFNSIRLGACIKVHFLFHSLPFSQQSLLQYQGFLYSFIIPNICHFFYTGKIFGELNLHRNLHSKLPIYTVNCQFFRVKSEKNYTGQKRFTRAAPVAPVTNMRYVFHVNFALHLAKSITLLRLYVCLHCTRNLFLFILLNYSMHLNFI